MWFIYNCLLFQNHFKCISCTVCLLFVSTFIFSFFIFFFLPRFNLKSKFVQYQYLSLIFWLKCNFLLNWIGHRFRCSWIFIHIWTQKTFSQLMTILFIFYKCYFCFHSYNPTVCIRYPIFIFDYIKIATSKHSK